MKLKLHFVALLLAALVATNAEADIVIDNFSDGDPLSQIFQGTNTQTSSGAGILGTNRDESITVRDFGDDDFIGTLGYSGKLKISQGTNDQIHGFLTYDDINDFDLTDGGVNTRFGIGFLSSDVNFPLPNVISLTAVSDAVSATRSLTVPPSSNLPQEVFVSFSDFTGVDFTKIDSITLSFDFLNQPGRDIELSFLSASVPEPSHLLLLMFGASGFLTRRRRS